MERNNSSENIAFHIILTSADITENYCKKTILIKSFGYKAQQMNFAFWHVLGLFN